MNTDANKTCIKCDQDKPADQFYARQGDCKACNNARSRAYQAANRERLSEQKLVWAQAHREQVNAGRRVSRAAMTDDEKARERAASAERSRVRRATEPDVIRANQKRHRDKNKDALNAATREWRAANKDKVVAYTKEYYAANAIELNRKSKAWQEGNPDSVRRIARKPQEESTPGAARKYFEWAGWEIELVSDTSRTARSLAAQLGRTYAAVLTMRHRIRHDPQTIQRAGLSSDGTL